MGHYVNGTVRVVYIAKGATLQLIYLWFERPDSTLIRELQNALGTSSSPRML